MKRFLALLAVLPVSLLLCGGAAAQSGRSFVSGHGSDTGTCPLTAPCRGFAYAASQTNAGGEITVLDPAGYGAVTLNKAISIVNDGVGEAGVSVTSGDAITINAGANDVVNLRGLTLVGSGSAQNGITFNTGAMLNIQNSVIRGFANSGINAVPSGSSAFNISDTIVSSNTQYGISVAPTGSSVTVSAMFERVQVYGTTAGLGFAIVGSTATGTVQAIAADCVASNNFVSYADGTLTGKANTTFLLVNSISTSNSQGPSSSGPNGVMYLAGSTAVGDTPAGIDGNGSTINSFGDNYITDILNGTTLTAVSRQ